VGIPAYFPASTFDSLLQLKGDTGARDLLRNARSVLSENLSFDIDTEEDIARLASETKSCSL
jgi:CTP:molybdopterin cytidylyltransferase MocA